MKAILILINNDVILLRKLKCRFFYVVIDDFKDSFIFNISYEFGFLLFYKVVEK